MLIRISQQPVAGTNKDLKNRNHHGTNIIGIPMHVLTVPWSD